MKLSRSLVFNSQLLLVTLAFAQSPGTISGSVNLDGEPLSGAVVSAYRQAETVSGYTANIVTQTSSDGRYSLTLASGAYIVIVSVSGKLVYSGKFNITSGQTIHNPINLTTSSATCAPVIKSLEIYERKSRELPKDLGLGGVFIYASDIHRFSNHPNGANNDLFVAVFEDDNQQFANIEKLAEQKKLSPTDLHDKASKVEKLTYIKSGQLTFAAHGAKFKLNVISRNDRLGAGQESVTLSVCRE